MLPYLQAPKEVIPGASAYTGLRNSAKHKANRRSADNLIAYLAENT